jgi:DNA-directed RNA polymerase
LWIFGSLDFCFCAFSEFPKEHVDASSKYLARKTFESLNEMFTASQEIQDWLTACAKVKIPPMI